MIESERIVKFGLTGQNYITLIFGHGQSKNDFDNQKDGVTINGIEYEVKTQSPYVTTCEVSFRTNQIAKCLQEGKKLYFVVIEAKGYKNFSYNNKVFLAKRPDLLKSRYYTKGWGDMIGFPLHQDGLEQVNIITDEYWLGEFYKYRKGGP